MSNTASDGSPDHEATTRALFRSIALERAGYYDSVRGGPPRLSFWQKRIRRVVLTILDARLKETPMPRRLLDAGCGRGDFTMALAARYPGLEEILGCDFSPELIELATSSASVEPRVRFSVGDLTALPFDSARVDATVCLNVLHHVSHDRLAAALDELARVSARTLILEIKNARSPYFRMHSHVVEGVAIFPVTVRRIRDGLRPKGFELRRQHAIFGIERLSPLVVLHFERAGRAVPGALEEHGLVAQHPA